MKTFFNVEDLGDLKAALAEAQEVKANRFGYQELGKNKTRARCECRCMETGDRAWRYHGWRQERAPAGGYPCDG